jgi:CBS-domain-containing membrane protein
MSSPSRTGLTSGSLSAGVVMLGAMSLLAVTDRLSGWHIFALPFVASAAVVAMAPHAPLARPAAIVPSYLASTAIAVTVTALAGPSVLTATAAAAPSVIALLLLKAPHAPAAVAAAMVGLTDPGAGYLLTALLAVAIVLGTAVLAGRMLPRYSYPATWR